MGRFFLCFALTFFAIIASLWVWVAARPLAYLAPDYAIWLAKAKLLEDHHGDTVAAFGDSTPAAALIPARLGPRFVNLALTGGSLVDTFYWARKLVSTGSPPQALIISVPPHGFTGDIRFWSYSIGFNFMTFADGREIRQRARILNDNELLGPPSIGDLDTRLKLFLYSIRFPACYTAALIDARLYHRYDSNRRLMNQVLADRGHFLFHGGDPAGLDDNVPLRVFAPKGVFDYYFGQTLALCQSHHVPVYFIATPHNASSDPYYWPGLKQAFTDYLNQYARRYPNFHVLGDTMPSYPSNYFADPAHMNREGAILWSDHVRQLLNDARVEGGPFIVN